MTSIRPPQTASYTEAQINQEYLDQELLGLRWRLQHRILWLRRQWQPDPLQGYQEVISDAEADSLLAGDNIQAEAEFYQTDPDAAALSHALTELEQSLLQRRQALAQAGTPLALDRLVQIFGLSEFERAVLLLSLAPERDPAFARLYAYVQDEIKCTYATPQLAWLLYRLDGCDWGGMRDALLPEAPLRRFRLITLAANSLASTSPIELDERMIDYLRGVNHLDQQIADLLRSPTTAPLGLPHRELVDRLAEAIRADTQQQWATINLVGAAGVGKQVVAQALCRQLGLLLYRLDITSLLTGSDRQELLHLLEREAALSQFALYVNWMETESLDANSLTTLRNWLERLGVFLVIGSRERWQTDRATLVAPVAKLDAKAQQQLWRQVLGDGAGLDKTIEAIVQQFEFGPEAVVQVASMAAGQAQLRSASSDVTAAELWQACREQVNWQLDQLAQPITPTYTWTDIVLPEDSVQLLQEIAAQVAHRTQVYEAWGFGSQMSRGRSINALFSGASGTGKTMAAEILANQLQLDLYRIDLAGMVSKYIGETEKNLRKVFDTAEQTGAILFFDEADALFGKRTEVKDSHDRYANIEVNYLLQRLEDYRGLAILATNRKADMDRAFLRRLRFLIDFPFPDAESRRRIWQQVFPPQAPLDSLDYASLARLEIPGGNIRTIAINAAFLAAHAGMAINMAHVIQATRREYIKIDKLITQSEFGQYYSLVKI
jgi:ATP-dependent 26S proteasome regulatory subunit